MAMNRTGDFGLADEYSIATSERTLLLTLTIQNHRQFPRCFLRLQLAYYDNLIILKKIINYPINHLLVTLVFGIDGKYITSTF